MNVAHKLKNTYRNFMQLLTHSMHRTRSYVQVAKLEHMEMALIPGPCKNWRKHFLMFLFLMLLFFIFIYFYVFCTPGSKDPGG